MSRGDDCLIIFFFNFRNNPSISYSIIIIIIMNVQGLIYIIILLSLPLFVTGTRGGAMVEALRYKPEGRGIDS
jgi:hypothetical protein